jgi:hypothetical protein
MVFITILWEGLFGHYGIMLWLSKSKMK